MPVDHLRWAASAAAEMSLPARAEAGPGHVLERNRVRRAVRPRLELICEFEEGEEDGEERKEDDCEEERRKVRMVRRGRRRMVRRRGGGW